MKIIRLLVIILIFMAGIYVGNNHVPRSKTVSEPVISLPDLTGADFASAYSAKNAQTAVAALAALSPEEQKQAAAKQMAVIEGALLYKDYRTAREKYRAEIALQKNPEIGKSAFATAAAAFYAAKKDMEKFAEDLAKKEEAASAAAAAANEAAQPPSAPVQQLPSVNPRAAL